MKSTHSSGVWDTLLIIAVAALAVTFSHATRAAADEAEDEGRIVTISPQVDAAQNQPLSEDLATAERAVDELPTYWLGIEGGTLDSPVLRTHLQLADDVGVVVRAVSPGSPAEKAGLRQHDIIIGVGGDQVVGMETLQKAVADSNAKPLKLKVIRLAKEESIEVTPEKMPMKVAEWRLQEEPFGFNFNSGDVLAQIPGGGGGGMRIIGPGMILGGQGFDASKLPGGVSVQITREGDGPATITVKKGDQTWNIEGNDQEALKKLPDDVRPFVEQMIQGGGQAPRAIIKQFQTGQGFQPNMVLPKQLKAFNFEEARERADEASQRMLKQMEQMEKRMQEMQRRFDEQFPQQDANPALDPSKT